jgi:hypothetical protein
VLLLFSLLLILVRLTLICNIFLHFSLNTNTNKLNNQEHHPMGPLSPSLPEILLNVRNTMKLLGPELLKIIEKYFLKYLSDFENLFEHFMEQHRHAVKNVFKIANNFNLLYPKRVV